MNERDDIKKVKSIVKEMENVLIKKYNAVGLGVGYKIKNGKINKKVSIIFYVKKKFKCSELTSLNIPIIPKEIEGFPTDVVSIYIALS